MSLVGSDFIFNSEIFKSIWETLIKQCSFCLYIPILGVTELTHGLKQNQRSWAQQVQVEESYQISMHQPCGVKLCNEGAHFGKHPDAHQWWGPVIADPLLHTHACLHHNVAGHLDIVR